MSRMKPRMRFWKWARCSGESVALKAAIISKSRSSRLRILFRKSGRRQVSVSTSSSFNRAIEYPKASVA